MILIDIFIIIYIIKQDIHIYVAYSRQNNWNDLAEIFFFIFPRADSGPSASIRYLRISMHFGRVYFFLSVYFLSFLFFDIFFFV